MAKGVPMSKPSLCKGCSYASTGGGFIPPDKHGSRLVCWGEAGGEEEERGCRGFIGRSGRKLRTALTHAGLKVYRGYEQPLADELEEACFRNVQLCRPPKNKFGGFEVAQECLKRHQLRLMSAPSADSPVHSAPWISFGANATESLTGYRLPPLTTRGTLLPSKHVKDKWILSTIHPAFLIRSADDQDKGMDYLYPFMVGDIVKAMKHPRPCVPKVHAFANPVQVMMRFAQKQANILPMTWVSIDIEGKDGKPNVVGVSWNPDEVFTMGWGKECRDLIQFFCKEATPVFHNAAYDIPELEEAGVEPPVEWVDTINLAALYMYARGALNLQSQVLSFVPGSIAWKGLINHERGPNFEGYEQKLYRGLWRNVLESLGRTAPGNGSGWYHFYNGLDTAWTLELAHQLKERLTNQGRYEYYATDVMQPLQAPLLRMGASGLPVDPSRLEWHRKACLRLEKMSGKILQGVGQDMLLNREGPIISQVTELEAERAELREQGVKKFPKSSELSKLRGKLRAVKKNIEDGFSTDSPKQKCDLLYDHFGLPPVKNRKSGNRTSDSDAIGGLLNRLERGTIKPKNVPKAEALRALRAMRAGTQWAHWRRNYLERKLV